MANVPSKAKKIAMGLLRANREGRSWRRISHEDYAGAVHPGTLCRFAKSDGAWLPKDNRILVALGLKRPNRLKPEKPPLPEWAKRVKKRIAKMAKATRESLAQH